MHLSKRRLAGLLIAGVVLACTAVLFMFYSQTPAARAEALLDSCRLSKIPETCYTQNFKGITKQHGLAYALDTLAALQKQGGSSAGCHFIGHVVAHEAVANSPANWPEVMRQLPVEACTGGFLMGLLEARKQFEPDFKLGADTISGTCKVIKQQQGSEGAEQTCVHTMGHLVLVEARGDIAKALAMCAALEDAYYYECASGTFMENIYRRNLVAHGTKEKLVWNGAELQRQKQLCSSHTGTAGKACWRELSHMLIQTSKRDMAKVFTACQGSGNNANSTACYMHAVGVMALLGQNHEDHANLCGPYNADQKMYNQCLTVADNSRSKSRIEHSH